MPVNAVARLSALRGMLNARNPAKGQIVRAMEAHSGLTGLIAEKARATRKTGETVEFDCLWSSSLTSSTIKGKPDIEVVDTTQRLQIVEDILEVTQKPMIYDGDTGGEAEIFKFTVEKLQRLGVSMCIIEDKQGLKQNSLFGTDTVNKAGQQLADVDEFASKLLMGQRAKTEEDFMIVSRLEALIAGAGEEEALRRAKAYIEQGEVDAIMIHSKEKDPAEVVSFLNEYKRRSAGEGSDSSVPAEKRIAKRVPVVVVPTTYNSMTEEELAKAGASIAIHANHLIRSAYDPMMHCAESILEHGRSKEIEDEGKVLSVKKILRLIDQ